MRYGEDELGMVRLALAPRGSARAALSMTEKRGSVHIRINSMKVFLTGATGFVGKNMLRRLLAEGHAVRAALRGTAGAKGAPGPGI